MGSKHQVFHGKAAQHRKINAIMKLKDDNGCWWKGEEHCEHILVDYFNNIFAMSSPKNIQIVCEVVTRRLKCYHK